MLEGWEWLIIGVVAIVIIMWGPAKIPEFARSIGRAKGEFTKAAKEFNDAATLTTNTPSSSVTNAAPAPVAQATVIKSKDEMLLETAHSLGILTDGKTREQITEEVGIKVKSLSNN